MPDQDIESQRREWWEKLRCVRVYNKHAPQDDRYNGPFDIWFITKDLDESIHLPSESDGTKAWPGRVDMPTYSLGMIEPAADFFIEHPDAAWLLLSTERRGIDYDGGDFGRKDWLKNQWRPTILAYGEPQC